MDKQFRFGFADLSYVLNQVIMFKILDMPYLFLCRRPVQKLMIFMEKISIYNKNKYNIYSCASAKANDIHGKISGEPLLPQNQYKVTA